MKRIISLLLISLMVLALVSCGGGGSTGTNTQKQNSIFNIDDYVVEYKGYEFVTDDDGNDAIAVHYKFTNNSDAPAQFMWEVLSTYEQNANLLDPAIVTVDEDALEYMDDSATEDIQPGLTADVTATYVIEDKTSPITVTFVCEDFTTKNFEIKLDADSYAFNTDDQEETPVFEEVIDDGSLANTQWYGWWMVCDATGDYEDYDGSYFDCCVTFEKTNEGYILMSIWDEVFPDYESDCLGEIYFNEVDGRLVSEAGGFFFNGEDISKEAVIIDPEFTEYENTLFTTVDVEDENGTFVAAINLTQWGYEWDEEFTDLPTYYDSYFLPLMEEGSSLPKDISDIG